MRRRSRIAFTKLEALGNDFVLVDARTTSFAPGREEVIAMADRHRGIGFDQLLILRAPRGNEALCHVDIHNRDGGRAEQCGNGMRAVALWLHRSGEFDRHARVESAAGPVDLAWNGRESITATLPAPTFEPTDCGLSGATAFPVELSVGDDRLRVHGASLGNPHLVVESDHPPTGEELQAIGPALSSHERLAAGANVGLAWLRDPHHIDLRVFERGSGPTLACGSGACAAAVVMIRNGRATAPVEVSQPGGTLVIDWTPDGGSIGMTGPARLVFEGVIPWPT